MQKKKNSEKSVCLGLFLIGRDPLRDIPVKCPLPKQKTRYSSNGIAEDLPVLSGETKDQLYRKRNRHPSEDIPMVTGKTRAISLDDEGAGVGCDNLFNERQQLKERKSSDEISKEHSGSVSISVQGGEENHINLEEEGSPQFGERNSRGRGSDNRKKHVVIRAFFAKESGEVSLEEGEEVDVLQKVPSGWWYVKSDFYEGWAPSAFLAIGRSKSVSVESLEKPQVKSEHWQNEENLDGSPKQNRGELKGHTPQGKDKVVSVFI